MAVSRVAIFAAFFVGAVAVSHASGYRSPAHARTTYSFTCPAGASGHVAYSRDTVPRPSGRLELWVNGSHLQDDARVIELLANKSIESVSASCEGNTVVVFLQTWADTGDTATAKGTITIHVNVEGAITSVGA